MMTTAILILTMSSPILVVAGLLALAAWRDHRREAMVARQVRLTDALADELGPIVAPLVVKPLGGPWRVEIRVPGGAPGDREPHRGHCARHADTVGRRPGTSWS